MKHHHFQGLEAPEIDQKSIRKRYRKQHRFLDRFLMDFGPIWDGFWLQKSVEIAINFGIDFWRAEKWIRDR